MDQVSRGSRDIPGLMVADAQFVGAFDAADKVYFLLREIAIEQINCAKVYIDLQRLYDLYMCGVS